MRFVREVRENPAPFQETPRLSEERKEMEELGLLAERARIEEDAVELSGPEQWRNVLPEPLEDVHPVGAERLQVEPDCVGDDIRVRFDDDVPLHVRLLLNEPR